MATNIFRIFAWRLTLAAIVISAVFAAATYAYLRHQLTLEVIRLATAEANGFASLNARDLVELMRTPNIEIAARLDEYLAGNEADENGHFAMAELYDLQQRSLAEAARPEAEEVENRIDRTRHTFPVDDRPSYDRVAVDGAVYLRIVVPLVVQGARSGYFEGVYRLSEMRHQQMRDSAALAVVAVIGVVLATTLFLLPVILSVGRAQLNLSRKLLKANIEALDLLGGAIAKRDSDTHTHNYRVTLYATALAEVIGLPRQVIQELIKGSFLHDVGKIAISDTILLKPGKLDEHEFAVMKTHVDHGVDIIARSEWLSAADAVVRYHHEKYDGSGYPEGLSGESIPITARIFAIADVFDALTSKRPYKDAMPFERAMAILEEGSGRHFDPRLVQAFGDIARSLYQAYGNREDGATETALDRKTAEYFGV